MKFLLTLLTSSIFALAQSDPVAQVYSVWDREHFDTDYKARAQALLEISADWAANWPDSKSAWQARREALVGTSSRSAELWKQVDENLIRLSPPHTFAAVAAYDWIGANVNLEDAEALIASEIDWLETKTRLPPLPTPTLRDQIDEADSVLRIFDMLGTLAIAQIQLKQSELAHATIARVHDVLNGDFKRFYDQDPVEAFPDYQARYFSLSAQLAEAQGRTVDTLAFYQQIITNPYYRRAYPGPVQHTHALWKHAGGSDEAWVAFSAVPTLPPGVPGQQLGIPFQPWKIVQYKLPDIHAPGLGSRAWTLRDFAGKITVMYLWASWCVPCWSHLPVIQAVYKAIKDRPDVQLVTLSVDEDPGKLSSFMKEKGYAFPVVISKSYGEQLFPHMPLGQEWIVDRTATVRFHRMSNTVIGKEQAFIDEALYKIAEISNQSLK
jgi:peroxiredoxin